VDHEVVRIEAVAWLAHGGCRDEQRERKGQRDSYERERAQPALEHVRDLPVAEEGGATLAGAH
jgi:hypothetical protein